MTRALYWLLAGAVILALWLRDPLLALLALLLGLLAALTTLWDKYALAAVTYERRFAASRLFVGEETSLTVEITNAKPLPLAWLKTEDEFPSELQLARGQLHYSHKPDRRLLTNLLALHFYERVRKHYQLQAAHRGVLTFGPVELQGSDLFGFRRQERLVAQFDEIVVYPRVVPVTALGLPAGHPFGDAAARRRLADDPLRVAGARPYVPGDSPRYIHWKATARRRELQTRLFEPGATPRTAICLDVQTVRGMPGFIEAYLEYMITAAASVARWLLDSREAVGLYANTSRRHHVDLVHLPPAQRPAQWEAILDTLARLIDLPTVGFSTFLQAELPGLPVGAAVIAIAAAPDTPVYAPLLDAQRAGHPTWLLAVDDTPPADVPAGLRCTWIGGSAAYAALAGLELPA